MLGFKVYYDEEQEKFVANKCATEIKTATYGDIGELISWSATYKDAVKAADKKNFQLDHKQLFVVKCVQCQSLFVQTEDERLWFTGRGLFVPKRCDKCREGNKKARISCKNCIFRYW